MLVAEGLAVEVVVEETVVEMDAAAAVKVVVAG